MAGRLPNYEARQQQVETSQLIERGIQERKHVVVELGTGGGKSFAALVPSVLSGERVVYSTAVKSLQEQVADKDAPFVASLLEKALGRPIRYAVLKGRGNYVCLRNVDKLEQGGEFRSLAAVEAFRGLSEWIGQQREANDVADIETYTGVLPGDLRMDVVTSTDECTGQKCPMFNQCFAERAKGRAKAADIIIVNHKLLFVDALVREKTDGHAAMLPDYSILIVDEAHEAEDILRDTAGFEITPGRLTRLGWMLQKLTIKHPVIEGYRDDSAEKIAATTWAQKQDDILQGIDTYLKQLKTKLEQNDDVREMRLGDERTTRVGDAALATLLVAETGEYDPRPTISELAERMTTLAWMMSGGTPTWLEGDDRDSWLKLAEQTEKLSGEILTILAPEEDTSWVRRAKLDGENGKTRVILDAKPIDVAPISRCWFFGSVAKQRATKKDADGKTEYVDAQPSLVVISMSATIATNGTMRMFRERMGVDDAYELVSGSPFDYKNHALLYLPAKPEGMTPVQRNKPGYGDYVRNLCAEMKGLTLDANGGAFLLFTSRSMMNEVHQLISGDLERAGLLVMKQGDASRNQMIADFRANGNAVLFGLKTFGVGIDVQGNALRLVAIDKMPFNPPTDVVWEALCQHVKRNGGNDFRDLAMPHAIITLKQFSGRLIRSKTDRGVMALLDGRIQLKGYGREVIANMPPAPITSDPQRVKALYSTMGMEYDSQERTIQSRAAAAPMSEPTPAPRRFRRLSEERGPQRFRRLSRV